MVPRGHGDGLRVGDAAWEPGDHHGMGRVKASGCTQSSARGISRVPPVQAIPCLVHRSLQGVKRGWSIDWSKALGGREAEGFPGQRDAGSSLGGWKPRGGAGPLLAQTPFWGQSMPRLGTGNGVMLSHGKRRRKLSSPARRPWRVSLALHHRKPLAGPRPGRSRGQTGTLNKP